MRWFSSSSYDLTIWSDVMACPRLRSTKATGHGARDALRSRADNKSAPRRCPGQCNSRHLIAFARRGAQISLGGSSRGRDAERWPPACRRGLSRRVRHVTTTGMKSGDTPRTAVRRWVQGAGALEPAALRAAGISGRHTEKVEPTPSSLSISRMPRWRLTMCLTMARPSPVPPTARERAVSTR